MALLTCASQVPSSSVTRPRPSCPSARQRSVVDVVRVSLCMCMEVCLSTVVSGDVCICVCAIVTFALCCSCSLVVRDERPGWRLVVAEQPTIAAVDPRLHLPVLALCWGSGSVCGHHKGIGWSPSWLLRPSSRGMLRCRRRVGAVHRNGYSVGFGW